MRTIALISCVSKKRSDRARAEDMYTSPLFVRSLEYARKILKPDAIHILSAKHGLLDLEDEIDPYDETLNEKSTEERIEWSNNVIQQLNAKYAIFDDKFIFLAGRKYYEHLLRFFVEPVILMENLSIGERLKWLNNELSKGGCDKQ